MAVNGHHHKDNLRIFKDIVFFDLNSASYDWIDEAHSGKYPKELYDEYSLVGNTLVYENPAHAIITLREDGNIKIEGNSGGFIYGIDREAVGITIYDTDGRLSTAEVLSTEFTVNV